MSGICRRLAASRTASPSDRTARSGRRWRSVPWRGSRSPRANPMAGESPFTPTFERLRKDPRWIAHAVGSMHNVMRDAPEELLSILLGVGVVGGVDGARGAE